MDMNTTDATKEMVMKPCNLKELLGRYCVSTKTMRSWLQPHEEIIGKRTTSRYFTARQMRIIYECIGEPPERDQDPR